MRQFSSYRPRYRLSVNDFREELHQKIDEFYNRWLLWEKRKPSKYRLTMPYVDLAEEFVSFLLGEAELCDDPLIADQSSSKADRF